MEEQMRQNDLFTGEEAGEIAAENAPQPPGPSALERAAQRIASVQGKRSGSAGWDRLFARYPEAREGRLDAAVFDGVRSGMTPTEAYQAAAWRCTEQEERFLFRSGFRLARELSLLPGGLLRL